MLVWILGNHEPREESHKPIVLNIVFAETIALTRGGILNTNISPVGGDILYYTLR